MSTFSAQKFGGSICVQEDEWRAQVTRLSVSGHHLLAIGSTVITIPKEGSSQRMTHGFVMCSRRSSVYGKRKSDKSGGEGMGGRHRAERPRGVHPARRRATGARNPVITLNNGVQMPRSRSTTVHRCRCSRSRASWGIQACISWSGSMATWARCIAAWR